MGFFSDLKEDLSQAVNELLPEEEPSGVSPEKKPTEDAHNAAPALKPEGTQEDAQVQELSAMLDKLDDMGLPEELDAGASKERTAFGQTGGGEPEAEQSGFTAAEDAAQPAAQEEPESGEAPDSAEEAPLEELLAKALQEIPEAPKEENGLETGLESMLDDVLSSGAFGSAKEEEKSKEGENSMETNEGRIVVDETAVITAGMTVTGDMVSEGSLDVIGTVNGNIDVWGKLNVTGSINGNSKAAEIFADSAKISGEIVGEGAVKIGASSVIIGNITATSAVIAGAVKGDIDVRGPVVLDASAIVMGNIKSKSVQINNGAVIEGMCSQCYADVSPTSFFDDYKPEPKKARNR